MICGETELTDAAQPEKDQNIQGMLDELVHVTDEPSLIRARTRLQAAVDNGSVTHMQLLEQILFYLADVKDNPYSALLVQLPHDLKMEPIVYLRTCTKQLDAERQEVRQMASRFLGFADGSESGLRIDFSIYDPLLRENGELKDGLIRYMYVRSPGEALLAVSNVFLTGNAHVEERRDMIWAEHVVSEAIWIKRHNFQMRDQGNAGERAKQMLSSLSLSSHWWTRLYVVQIMRQHPVLRQTEVIQKLQKDEHAMVREAAASLVLP